jgi:hypothetical protein
MKSHISGIQIPTASRINIDGGLTLDAQAGNLGEMLISQGTGNTPIWSNTLTSPTINTSLVAGSASFNLLTTTATTINFGLAATTLNIATNNVTKTINLGTTGASSTTVNIGTNATSSSTINLQAPTVNVGRTTAGGTGVSAFINGPTVTGTTTVTAGHVYIKGGGAGHEEVFDVGTVTGGNVYVDAGVSSTTAGTSVKGGVLLGTLTDTGSVTIGRTGITTTINGTLALPSQTANTFFASPNSAAGAPSFRVLSYRDIYPAALPTTYGQVIEYAPVGGGMAWTTTAPLLKGGGTMTGAFVGATTSTSLAPIKLPSGTVPTTANQEFGMVAAAAESLQLSTTKTTGAGPGFGFIRAPQMVYAVANSTAATSTTPVSPFAAANDVLSSLEVGKAYRFRGVYYLSTTFTSGTATIQLAFAFSNAPVIFKYNYKTYNQNGNNSTFEKAALTASNAGTTISSASTFSTDRVVEFEGFFTSNATTASTLTPQILMNSTGSSTVATAGSFFEIEKLGTSSQTLIAGNWA